MAQFEPMKERFVEAGVSVVFIAAQKRGGLFKPEKFFQKHPSSWTFLLDEDRSVTKAWGVYQRLRTDAVNIARPATFVVDASRAIRWIYVGSNQFDRPPIATVLEHAIKAGQIIR
jgi:methyl-accepting chemotaxis protein